MDLDASCIVFDTKGQLMEAVYFDHLESSTLLGAPGAIRHHGDAISGDESLVGNDEVSLPESL